MAFDHPVPVGAGEVQAERRMQARTRSMSARLVMGASLWWLGACSRQGRWAPLLRDDSRAIWTAQIWKSIADLLGEAEVVTRAIDLAVALCNL